MRALALLAVFALTGCGGPARVILVRHAEKVPDVEDPGLTAEGHARAEALAAKLSGETLETIITSQYLRTLETADPVTRVTGIRPEVVELRDVDKDAEAMARRIRRGYRDKTVLIISHSNVIPKFLCAFGAGCDVEISEGQYDDYFVATVGPESATLERQTYGKRSKAGPRKAELQVDVVKAGDGPVARKGMEVTVHYTGRLTDGTVFDSSVERGEPFVFRLGVGQVIKGWDQGVEGMKVGGKRRLTVPPHLAYGKSGAGGAIPPNATLEFDVELLGVKE